MFGKRKKEIEALRRELDDARNELRGKYWEVYLAHKRLLDHLGLVETTEPQKTVIEPIELQE